MITIKQKQWLVGKGRALIKKHHETWHTSTKNIPCDPAAYMAEVCGQCSGQFSFLLRLQSGTGASGNAFPDYCPEDQQSATSLQRNITKYITSEPEYITSSQRTLVLLRSLLGQSGLLRGAFLRAVLLRTPRIIVLSGYSRLQFLPRGREY